MLQIYPTHDVHTVAFGENYSKFYEAFQQGLSTPKASKSTPSTVPAKRSAAASKHASKRRRQDDRASLPHLDQHQARVITAPRTAATKAKASLEAKSNEAASPSDVARKSPEPPRQRSYSDAKGTSLRMIIILQSSLQVFMNFTFNILLTTSFQNRAIVQAKRRGYLRGKLGIRYRRGEGTGVFERSPKDRGV